MKVYLLIHYFEQYYHTNKDWQEVHCVYLDKDKARIQMDKFCAEKAFTNDDGYYIEDFEVIE